jgi:hypothetical protein
MSVSRGDCFYYAGVAPEGLYTPYYRLLAPKEDGSWLAQPLLLASSVSAADLPRAVNQEAVEILDAEIRAIPALILETRITLTLRVSEVVREASSPILVLHDCWFRSGHVVHRAGMGGVYLIKFQLGCEVVSGKMRPH